MILICGSEEANYIEAVEGHQQVNVGFYYFSAPNTFTHTMEDRMIGSIIWCDRAKYTVKESPSEVESLIEDLKDTFTFVWFNKLERFKNEDDNVKQVALNISKISAIEGIY